MRVQKRGRLETQSHSLLKNDKIFFTFRTNRIEMVFKEKLNEAQSQIGFLKKEINCLNYIINQDETKMNELSEYKKLIYWFLIN